MVLVMIRPASRQIVERIREPGAPALDFVFTVCDKRRVKHVRCGRDIMTAHWGVTILPKHRIGSGNALAFKDAYRMLFQRIGIFTALPTKP